MALVCARRRLRLSPWSLNSLPGQEAVPEEFQARCQKNRLSERVGHALFQKPLCDTAEMCGLRQGQGQSEHTECARTGTGGLEQALAGMDTGSLSGKR